VRRRLADMTRPTPVDLDRVASNLDEFWSQETIGSANGSLFKVAKGTGSTNWHSHDDQDEVFLVTAGELVVELRTGDVTVRAGELLIVPRGVEHRPRAEDEAHFLLVGTNITSSAAGGKPDWSADAGATPDA
jgi:mannose-6-phosphate isomerase-like protein (cupin superfamily)